MARVLSDFEIRQTLHFVEMGLTNEQIGFQLHLGVTAVKNRLSKLMAQYGVKNRTGLITAARERGLLSDPMIRVTTKQQTNMQWSVVVVIHGESPVTVARQCGKADADMMARALRGHLNASTVTEWKKERGA